MPITWRANERRKITGIIFCRPESVARDLKWREPDPFAPRCAVIIEIQARVVNEDGESASNQQHHKKEIDEVAVTHPERKAVQPCEVVGVYLRNGWNGGKSRYGTLNPSRPTAGLWARTPPLRS